MKWLGALLVVCACADDHGPRLDTVAPASVVAGGLVVITGARLCGESGNCETAGGAIRIGLDKAVQANVLDYTETQAQLRIPSITPVGKTVLVATVNERASNTLDFEVLAP